MPFLSWDDVTKEFDGSRALSGVSLSVERGEILGVLGPSGSGKSTLLRLTAGLEQPTSGRVLMDGTDLAGVPSHRRGFGLMFQDYSLFPHLDVRSNIAFGLRMSRWSRERRRARVAEMLRLVHMDDFGARDVLSLSGGEQQRVALARSLAPGPRLLMLDEPLGALDATLKSRLLSDLSEILHDVGVTVLYVTHDHEEAMTIAGRVAVLRAGSIQQAGSPAELISCPSNAFVAEFLGLGVLVPCRLSRSKGAWLAATTMGDFPSPVAAGYAPRSDDGADRLLVRPEALHAERHAGWIRTASRVLARLVKSGGTIVRLALSGAHGETFEIECHADVTNGNGFGRTIDAAIREVWIDPARCLALPGPAAERPG
jgi:ABC-type Fe3+/spermidine/putrescine transport system ATPase subunit